MRARGEAPAPSTCRFHLPLGQPLASECRSTADWDPYLGLMRTESSRHGHSPHPPHSPCSNTRPRPGAPCLAARDAAQTRPSHPERESLELAVGAARTLGASQSGTRAVAQARRSPWPWSTSGARGWRSGRCGSTSARRSRRRRKATRRRRKTEVGFSCCCTYTALTEPRWPTVL